MSRENPFAKLDLSSINNSSPSPKPGYGMTGAAKTVVRSIEDLAENSKKLMEGEVIVELDPQLLEDSFVADRLSGDDEDYQALKTAIEAQGQTSPILVRPSENGGRAYMVVFGHRRARVAKELGIPVKAVVKSLDDVASVIAQGQENSARANLSFIERAFFAENLLASGMSKEIIRTSLSIDEAMLSKMLGVVEIIPTRLINALGACKKIGRDKWLALRQILLAPALHDVAFAHISTPEFVALSEESRFDNLHTYLKRYKVKSEAKKPKTAAMVKEWTSPGNDLSLVMNARSKKVAIELSKAEASPFADWLSTRMDRLYDEYKQSQ